MAPLAGSADLAGFICTRFMKGILQTQRKTYTSLDKVPAVAQTYDEIIKTDFPNVHVVADKIFKWCSIGVQGGLLSNVLEPIIPTGVYFGAINSLESCNDIALRHSFCKRLTPQPSDVIVETNKFSMEMVRGPPHIWSRGMECAEMLDCKSGQTVDGTPSTISRSEILKSFVSVYPQFSSYSYGQAKDSALSYQAAKCELYEKLQNAGYGAWQRKPAEFGAFHLAQ